MKIQHAEQHVLGSHGLSETRAFSIRTNAHAFKMLSSGLYSDKVAAVLREIGCNAYDAHVEYGSTQTPIVVKLPNRIDNQFYIRDYGPGLSHKDVMELYTTYFASTKQTSDEYTGAFGLGSKSPFSYTDSFSVISVHNGKKRTYSAYLDNNGSPTISLLTETTADPDWSHGVQIGFPVKPGDFTSFESRAQNIFRWFKVKPKIEGASAIREIAPSYDSTSFAMYTGNINGHTLGAVMGNVFYPVDVTKVETNRHIGLFAYAGYFPGIVLKLNIGEVQVAASREELQYDEASKKVLRDKIEEAVRTLGTDIANQLRTARTWAEKCTAHQMVKLKGGNMYSSSWHDFFKALGVPDYVALAGLASRGAVPLPDKMGAESLAKVITPSYRKVGISIDSIKAGKFENGQTAAISLRPKTLVYYGEKTNAIVKTRTLFEESKAEAVLLFTPDTDNGKTVAEAENEARLTAAELGIPAAEDIANVALPKNYSPPVKKKYVKKGKTLPPLPSKQVVVVSVSKKSDDISTLPPNFHTFMVRSKRTGSWRTDQMRVYINTADSDFMMEESKWQEIWKHMSMMNSVIKTPFTGYVEVSALEVKQLDLVKRNWKPTYIAIKDWLDSQTTRDEIAKAAAAWVPSMRLDDMHQHGWAGELVLMRHRSKPLYDRVQPWLKQKGLDKSIELIHETSVKQGAHAGTREPKVLTAYRHFVNEWKLPAITVQTASGFLTIEDFSSSIRNSYALTQTFSHQTLREIYEHYPTALEGFIKLVFQ